MDTKLYETDEGGMWYSDIQTLVVQKVPLIFKQWYAKYSESERERRKTGFLKRYAPQVAPDCVLAYVESEGEKILFTTWGLHTVVKPSAIIAKLRSSQLVLIS